MAEKYNLETMLKEIKEDEALESLKKKKVSQEDIQRRLAERQKEKRDKKQ